MRCWQAPESTSQLSIPDADIAFTATSFPSLSLTLRVLEHPQPASSGGLDPCGSSLSSKGDFKHERKGEAIGVCIVDEFELIVKAELLKGVAEELKVEAVGISLELIGLLRGADDLVVIHAAMSFKTSA